MNFNARQYDPQIGSFLGVDPLADAYGQQVYSPYAAMGNMPESAIDPNGTSSQNFEGGDAQTAFRELQSIFGNSTFKRGEFKEGGSGENWNTFLSDLMSNPGSYSIETLFSNNSDAFMNYIMGGTMWFELANVDVKSEKIGSKSDLIGDVNTYYGNYSFLISNALSFVTSTETGKFLTVGGGYIFKASAYTAQKNILIGMAKIMPKLELAGNTLGVIGLAITAVDIYNNGFNISNTMDFTVGIVSFIPGVGWIIGGAYFVGNTLSTEITGKSIGAHVQDYVSPKNVDNMADDMIYYFSN